MHKRPQFLAQSKTDRMSNNASCKRWDTPVLQRCVQHRTNRVGDAIWHGDLSMLASTCIAYTSRLL
jgi:hypothetical protein